MRFAIFPNLGKEKLFTFLPELLRMIEERKSSALLPLSMKEGLEAGGIKGLLMVASMSWEIVTACSLSAATAPSWEQRVRFGTIPS